VTKSFIYKCFFKTVLCDFNRTQVLNDIYNRIRYHLRKPLWMINTLVIVFITSGCIASGFNPRL